MPDIKIRITNLPQIRAAFARSPYLMARNLREALVKAANEIKARSMADTPVDTGRLQRSHYTRFNPYSALGFYAEVGTGAPGDAKASYDVYVHQGTRYMRGRPYLFNAVADKQNYVDGLFTDAVNQTLRQIASKV